MRVGQFHKSIEEDPVQEERLLKSINLEYQSETNDWSTQYEFLELRMDLTKHIEEIILDEVINDMMIFLWFLFRRIFVQSMIIINNKKSGLFQFKMVSIAC